MPKKYSSSRGGKSFTLADYIESEVHNSPDYYSGQIESLESKVNKLTSILSEVIKVLPPSAEAKLAKSLCLEEHHDP